MRTILAHQLRFISWLSNLYVHVKLLHHNVRLVSSAALVCSPRELESKELDKTYNLLFPSTCPRQIISFSSGNTIKITLYFGQSGMHIQLHVVKLDARWLA